MFIIEAKTREGLDRFIHHWTENHNTFTVNKRYVTDQSFPLMLGGFVDPKKQILTIQPIGLTHKVD